MGYAQCHISFGHFPLFLLFSFSFSFCSPHFPFTSLDIPLIESRRLVYYVWLVARRHFTSFYFILSLSLSLSVHLLVSFKSLTATSLMAVTPVLTVAFACFISDLPPVQKRFRLIALCPH